MEEQEVSVFELIHAFGAGIAFAVGVTVGAVLSQIATARGRAEIVADWKEHHKAVEDRLAASMRAHVRMADALESLSRDSGNQPRTG